MEVSKELHGPPWRPPRSSTEGFGDLHGPPRSSTELHGDLVRVRVKVKG